MMRLSNLMQQIQELIIIVGLAKAALEQFEESIKDFDKSIQLNPEYTSKTKEGEEL